MGMMAVLSHPGSRDRLRDIKMETPAQPGEFLLWVDIKTLPS